MNKDEKAMLLEKLYQLNQLNQLHKKLKSGFKTDLVLLTEIKLKLNEIQFTMDLRPMGIKDGLSFENEEYLMSYTKHEDLQCEKYFAARDGDFEKAAQFRDKARNVLDVAMDKVLLETYPNQGPFYLIHGWVYYYKLDSRIMEMI